MRQLEDRYVNQESKRAPQHGKSAYRAGDVVITPFRFLQFLIFVGACLALAILLVK